MARVQRLGYRPCGAAERSYKRRLGYSIETRVVDWTRRSVVDVCRRLEGARVFRCGMLGGGGVGNAVVCWVSEFACNWCISL